MPELWCYRRIYGTNTAQPSQETLASVGTGGTGFRPESCRRRVESQRGRATGAKNDDRVKNCSDTSTGTEGRKNLGGDVSAGVNVSRNGTAMAPDARRRGPDDLFCSDRERADHASGRRSQSALRECCDSVYGQVGTSDPLGTGTRSRATPALRASRSRRGPHDRPHTRRTVRDARYQHSNYRGPGWLPIVT